MPWAMPTMNRMRMIRPATPGISPAAMTAAMPNKASAVYKMMAVMRAGSECLALTSQPRRKRKKPKTAVAHLYSGIDTELYKIDHEINQVKTMLDLPVPRAIMGDMRKFIHQEENNGQS